MNVFNNEKLRNMRRENGFTQAQISERIGVARTTYAEYEQGKIQPPIEKIQRICKLFGIETSALLKIENDTGIDVSKVRFKRALSDSDKILRIQQLKRKQGILKDIEDIRTIVENSNLTEIEKQAIFGVIACIKYGNRLTDADIDLMFRIDRSERND
jgi:transcriptional regulator with XRE-family HTH domain